MVDNAEYIKKNHATTCYHHRYWLHPIPRKSIQRALAWGRDVLWPAASCGCSSSPSRRPGLMERGRDIALLRGLKGNDGQGSRLGVLSQPEVTNSTRTGVFLGYIFSIPAHRFQECTAAPILHKNLMGLCALHRLSSPMLKIWRRLSFGAGELCSRWDSVLLSSSRTTQMSGGEELTPKKCTTLGWFRVDRVVMSCRKNEAVDNTSWVISRIHCNVIGIWHEMHILQHVLQPE